MVCEVGEMKCYPTKFEAVNEINDLAFTVECFDESCASVTIQSLVTVESWREMSAMIEQCLIGMKLGE
jgi:hypothetical protein